eukprot:sb/3466888/
MNTTQCCRHQLQQPPHQEPPHLPQYLPGHSPRNIPFKRGKFARVFKCQHKKSGQYYAAKFLHPCHQTRVDTEVAVLRQFCHNRNIIGLFDVFTGPTETILVLEYVQGGELLDVVGSLLKTEYDLTHVVKQLCNALYCLHYKDIVHKDVKPENVLVCETNLQVKMVDFGLAQHLTTTPGSSIDTDHITGTPEFIAPEILCRRYVGTQIDMWCLGVTVYIALTGMSPFQGNSDVETLSKILHCSYYTGEDLFGQYSDAALDFVKKLLVCNPRKRLTAAQCLAHPWLTKRKQSNQAENLLPRLDQLIVASVPEEPDCLEGQ